MEIDTKGFEIEDVVRDRITGFEGKITGITQWSTGCARASVQAPWDPEKGGKIPDAYSIDVLTLDLVEAGPRHQPDTEQTDPEAAAALYPSAASVGADKGGPAELIERDDDWDPRRSGLGY